MIFPHFPLGGIGFLVEPLGFVGIPGDFGPVGLAEIHLLEIGGLPDWFPGRWCHRLFRKDIGAR